MATIRKRSGKYQALVRKDSNYISKTFTNRADAVKWGKEQEVKIEQGSYVSKKEKVTLGFLLSRWRDEVLIHLKSYPVERFKVDMIKRSLGSLTLDKVTSALLVTYRDKRLLTVSNQTVKHELGIIRRSMKKGIEWGYCDSVPYLASPSLRGCARDRRLNDADMNLLLDNCDDYLAHVLTVLTETAMRRGELAKLLIADIDLKSRLLTLSDTKNGETRVVPASVKCLASIEYLIEHAKSDRLLNYSKDWLTRKFQEARGQASIEDFRLHDLRHEGVSRLFEKGLNVMEASAISGHKDLSMLKRYTHINPTTLLSKLG